jgi:hypothetical protein
VSPLIIQWLIFLHVLAAVSFFLFHGASAAMAFKLRQERDFAHCALLGCQNPPSPAQGFPSC